MVTEFEREKQLREACAELDRRLRSGENCSAESVLTASPLLAADRDSALELVYTEFAVRDELNLSPKTDEWYMRFPAWRKELQELFEVHRFFSENATLDDWTPPDTLVESAPVRQDSEDGTQGEAAELNAFPARRDFSIGDYQVCREVGRGAMGVVYEARQLRLNRVVAIKMILNGEFAGPQQLQRFHAECGAIARLQHPNIVQIFEVGEHDGQAFCSLEYVDGGGLEHYLEHNRPTIRECAELVETLARTMAYVHRCGIIHRDLKPANVLLYRESGLSSADRLSSFVPKITDFGLAKQDSQFKANSTQDGTIIGTPGYMAPEQALGRNKDIGPATDLHALGAILYETLVGQPPFHAPTTLEILELVRSCPPTPLTRLRRNIPRDLETICLKCLDKSPARRYSSAMDLADDLRRFLNHEAVQARPNGVLLRTMRWCQRRPLVAGLCLALATSLIIGMVGILWQWRRADFHESVAFSEGVSAKDQRTVATNERARAEENLLEARKLIARLTRHADKLTDQPQMDDAQRATLEETLDFYCAFIENNPGDSRLRLEAIRACIQVSALQDRLGKYDLAENTLRKGLLLFDEAEASCLSACEWRLEHGRCWNDLGHIQRSKKQFEKADDAYLESIQILKPLLKVTTDKTGCQLLLANAFMNQAVALRALGRMDDAVNALRQAINLQEQALRVRPKDSGSRMEFALALDDLGMLLADQGLWDDAMPLCKQALQIRTEVNHAAPKIAFNRESLARSLHNVGKLQIQAKQFSEGIESLRMAVRLRGKLVEDYPSRVHYEPQFVSSVNKLGLQLFRSGEREQSLVVYEDAIKVAPDQAVLLNSSAWIYATSGAPSVRDLAQALSFAERATQLVPDSQAFWNTLGVVRYRRGEWTDASHSLRQSVALAGGENCFNWLFLAMTEYQLGDHETAIQWHQKAMRELERVPTQDKELIGIKIEADAMLGHAF